jgi:hypothetical protein
MGERILVFTPRLRVFGRALASVFAMRKAWGRPIDCLEIQNDQPSASGNENVLRLYQQARRVLLADPRYTHLLTIEDDMVVPPDAVERLRSLDAPVAYGTYCWRWGPPHRLNAYRELREAMGCSWGDAAPQIARQYLKTGSVIDVAGTGLGCTLIRRDVLEAIDFRLGLGAANDWYFAVDCQQMHVRQVAHFGVQCGHIRLDPSARVIWPDATADRLFRYEYFEVP